MYDNDSSESGESSEMWEPESDGEETEEVLMEDDWAESRCWSSAVAKSPDLSIVAGFWLRSRRLRFPTALGQPSDGDPIPAPPLAPEPTRTDAAPVHASGIDPQLEEILNHVRRQFHDARECGQSIKVTVQWTGGLDCVDAVESRYKRVEPCEEDEVFIGAVRDESKMKGWRKLRNGITMDSGLAVDMIPEDENPEFKTVPLSGSRIGRKLGAANGTPIDISGKKWIEFTTKEGWSLRWPFIAGKVKNTLKSVGTTCDADNYVLFRKDRGYIVHENDEAFIEFDRVGNVYVIDVWVRIGSSADKEASDFVRQAVVP